jgi:hypothetical protein
MAKQLGTALGLVLGVLGIAAGILAQVGDNSVHQNNPLLIGGAIVLGSSIIAAAIAGRTRT